MPSASPPGGRLRNEAPGLCLLAAALLWNSLLLAPELRLGTMPLNDLVFHRAASERLGEAFLRAEPFLDPWVSEWSLGYPVWRSYQPLPHLVAAFILRLSAPLASTDAAFAALYYALLTLLPLSVYWGARLLGLRPAAAGLASCLVLLPAADGEFGRYGLGYGATTWRGSGLYTQLFALHLLLPFLGVAARALDTGRRRAAAAVLLALTALSHIVFGYVAAVSAFVLAVVGDRGGRARRLVRLATIAAPAALLLLWFVVPLFATAGEVNHSRWEDAHKWDSFGAPRILREIAVGSFFDAGRPPVLSLALLAGIAAAIAAARREALARRLLALAVVWLLLFFGRATWGHLLVVAGVPRDLHLHRLQAAFELCAILAAAFGLERLLRLAMPRRALLFAGCAALLVLLFPAILERARYLRQQVVWGTETLTAWEAARPDLDAAITEVRRILAERPGRVTAGKAATWGRAFKVGSVPVYAFLARHHLDSLSFLYHSMSLTSDIMVLREESDRAHDFAFGVRAAIAPAEHPAPAHWRLRARHGRFAVYENAPEGYFGLVDIGAVYEGPRAGWYDTNSAWLASPLLRQGIVAALDRQEGAPEAPGFGRWEPFPAPDRALLSHRGRIVSETKIGENYRAQVSLVRPCFAFVKVTYHPGLVARVDGGRASTYRVTPGFTAIPVPAGEHTIEVSYVPGPVKPALLALGLALFGVWAWALRGGRGAAVETSTAQGLAAWGRRLATPRAATAAALAVCAVLALRPLFRGLLIDGHDAASYLPRLVEMGVVLADGQIPPLWAPHLGNGHGQPLFQFAPPLLYFVALPFRGLGLGLADSIQLALLLLFLAGTAAVYRIGRELGYGRSPSLGAAALWLFAPYLALDLFVRGAFAEAAALACAPIALLGVLRAIRRPSLGRVALASAALALVVLSHNAAALLLLPAIGVAALAALAAEPRERRIAALAAVAAAMVLGLLLSAFFWFPALAERDLVKTDLLRQDFLEWRLHSASLWQLLWSRWGFGLSMPGSGDGMSFMIGPAHLILGLAGLVVALRQRRRVGRLESDSGRGQIAMLVAFAALAAAGAWLATALSAPLWSRLELLQYFAYPWRALMLPALFLPLLALPALARFARRPWWLAALLAVVAILNLRHTEPKGYLKYDEEFYAPAAIAWRGLNTTTREEYEPRWVEQRPPYQVEPLRGLGATLQVQELERHSHRARYRVTTPVATPVEASTFFYPRWTILVDGAPTTILPVPVRGTIMFDLPAGEHEVVLELLPTTLRSWTTRISAAAFIVCAAALVAPAALRALRSRAGTNSRAAPARGPRPRAPSAD